MDNTKVALIVDDEAIVRLYESRVLESLHFQVLESDSEKSAWDQFLERENDIQYVLIELNLVYGNGLNLYRRIRERNKETVVILCSDFVESFYSDVMNDPKSAFLVKPFSLKTLINTTRLVEEGPVSNWVSA